MGEIWTADEISNYNKNFKKEGLGPAYLNAEIPSNEPHKRVDYLLDRLNLPKKIYNKNVKLHGKELALSMLEETAIKDFF